MATKIKNEKSKVTSLRNKFKIDEEEEGKPLFTSLDEKYGHLLESDEEENDSFGDICIPAEVTNKIKDGLSRMKLEDIEEFNQISPMEPIPEVKEKKSIQITIKKEQDGRQFFK
jgi:hypothetical protein